VASTATKYLDSLSREAGSDPQLQMELAAGYVRLASVQGHLGDANLGQSKNALASYNKAIDLAAQVLNRNRNNREALRLMAQGLTNRSEIEIHSEGNYKAGLASLNQAVDYSNRLLDTARPDAGDMRIALAIESKRAERTAAMNPKDAAVQYTAIIRKGNAMVDQTNNADLRRVLVEAHINLARAQHSQGDPVTAIATNEAGLRVLAPLLSADPNNVNAKIAETTLIDALAALYGDTIRFHVNQPKKAIEILQRLEQRARKALAADPRNNNAQQSLSITLVRMGRAYLLFDARAAEQAAREGLAVADALSGSGPSNYRYQRLRSNAIWPLSEAYIALGQPAKAIQLLPATVPSAAESLKLDPNDLATLATILGDHLRLATAFKDLRQWPKATAHLEEGRQLGTALLKRLPEDLYFLRDLALIEETAGDLELARRNVAASHEQYQTATALWQRWTAVASAPGPYPELHLNRLRAKMAR
jgi:non-specific serine/threonine protein kinase/serine/threonine-protein kinase